MHKDKQVVTLLSIALTKQQSVLEGADFSIVEQLSRISDLAQKFGGRMVSALNDDLLIVFEASRVSEKHAIRAYYFYAQAFRVLLKSGLFLRAAMHSDAVSAVDQFYHGDAIEIARRIPKIEGIDPDPNRNIIFSEGAKALLENELEFISVSKSLRYAGSTTKLFSCKKRTKQARVIPGYFSGRKIELEILENRSALKTNLCVVGAAGVGKTSLVEFFLKRKVGLTSFRCAFSEKGYEATFVKIIEDIFVDISISSETSKNVWLDRLADLLELDEPERFFLFRHYSDEVILNASDHLGISIIEKALRKISQTKEICIFFDDIQWATEGFELLISHLSNLDLPIFTISTSRVMPKNKNDFEIVNLKSLNRSDVAEIAQKLLPHDLMTDELVSSIYQKTSGNPFYIAEYLKNIGLSLDANSKLGYQSLNLEDFSSENLPINLANLVHFQIGNLEKGDAEILHISACIGQRFNEDLIARIIQKDASLVRQTLNSLCDKDFLKFGIRSNNNFEFIHSIKEDVVYKSINASSRKKIHEKIAHAISQDSQIRSKEVITFLSRQLFLGQEWGSAYRASLRAAKMHLASLEPRFAMEAISRCLVCAEKIGVLTKVRELRLRLMLSRTYFILGEVHAAGRFITPISNIFSNRELLKYPKAWNEALNELTFFYWIAAQYPQTLDMIETAERDFSTILNSQTLGALKIRRIGVYSDNGQIEESSRLIDELLSSESTTENFEAWSSVFPVRAVLHALRSRNSAYRLRYRSFEDHALKALNLARSQSVVGSKIFTLCFVADGYLQFNEIIKAKELLAQAVELMDGAHIYVLKGYIMSMLGYCEVILGQESGIYRITNAIVNAERDGRICRLPLFYLFLSKAICQLPARAGLKRNLSKGIKLAKRQGEYWVLEKLYSLANEAGINLASDATQSVDNIVKFSDYVRAEQI